MNKETRKESSIPVQARISIVDLAKMCAYWEIKEQVVIKSMSQLVGWTFSAMVDVIEANGKMIEGMNSVAEANKYLQVKGLYQRSLRKRSQSRIVAALGFENLRDQGLDPAIHSPFAHKVIHSKHSAEPFNGQVDAGKEQLSVPQDEMNKMVKIFNKLESKDTEKHRLEELKNAKQSMAVKSNNEEVTLSEVNVNEMSEEEWLESMRKKDEDRVKLENAPVDVRDFELVKDDSEKPSPLTEGKWKK